MFGSMAECVDLEESIYLPMLMNMVPSINFNNITLLSTALYMIGLYYFLNAPLTTAHPHSTPFNMHTQFCFYHTHTHTQENCHQPSIADLLFPGSFGEWMNNHPEILSCVLPLVLQGLGNSKVGTAATMALKDITRESLDHIRPFIPQILSTSQVSQTFTGGSVLFACAVLHKLTFTETLRFLLRAEFVCCLVKAWHFLCLSDSFPFSLIRC